MSRGDEKSTNLKLEYKIERIQHNKQVSQYNSQEIRVTHPKGNSLIYRYKCNQIE